MPEDEPQQISMDLKDIGNACAILESHLSDLGRAEIRAAFSALQVGVLDRQNQELRAQLASATQRGPKK